MRFDLIRACKMCPFAKGGLEQGRIVFRGRERAEEIEETAYREGFVCHEHAEYVENHVLEEDGYYPREDGSSQHCFGAIAMYLHEGSGGNIPWEHATEEDEGLEKRWWDRVALKDYEQCFDGTEEFIEANAET